MTTIPFTELTRQIAENNYSPKVTSIRKDIETRSFGPFGTKYDAAFDRMYAETFGDVTEKPSLDLARQYDEGHEEIERERAAFDRDNVCDPYDGGRL